MGTHRLLCGGPAPMSQLVVFPTLAATIVNRFEAYLFRRFVGAWNAQDKAWRFVSYFEVYSAARSLASTFLNALKPAVAQDQQQRNDGRVFVAICAHNCHEWITTDFACTFADVVSVPLHTTLPVDHMSAMLQHASCSVLFCDQNIFETKVLKLAQRPEHVIVFGSKEWNEFTTAKAQREAWDEIREPTNFDALRTLLFTSGSTGVPKESYNLNSLLLFVFILSPSLSSPSGRHVVRQSSPARISGAHFLAPRCQIRL